MAKQEPNRAQRRMEAKRDAVPHVSFWQTNAAVLIIGIGIAAVLLGGLAVYRRSQAEPAPAAPATTAPNVTSTPATPVPTPQQPATPPADPNAKLETKDVKVGTGAEAKAGDTVSVHYTGTLPDGTKFDSSKDRGQPFEFKLGSGMVIKGWDQGVAGMKVGGTRKLVVPPSLGYGPQAKGKIPANSTLLFDVELLDVKSGSAPAPAAPAAAPPTKK